MLWKFGLLKYYERNKMVITEIKLTLLGKRSTILRSIEPGISNTSSIEVFI